MKIGILGPSFSGKSTIFRVLTGYNPALHHLGSFEHPKAVAKVAEPRLTKLASLYNSKKMSFIELEYTDLKTLQDKENINLLHQQELLVCVLGLFEETVEQAKSELRNILSDFIVLDLDVVEKRLDKLRKTMQKNKAAPELAELPLVEKCRSGLDKEIFLENLDFSAEEQKLLKGYGFLTLKPLLVILNISENDLQNVTNLETEFKRLALPKRSDCLALCGKLEEELSQLEEVDKKEFLENYGLKESVVERTVFECFALLDLISFFTANENEVKAWAIPRGTSALKAAGVVHSDMERGFIKAEVINVDKLLETGSVAKAKEKGLVRLEGKDYIVQNEDVIFYRFNI